MLGRWDKRIVTSVWCSKYYFFYKITKIKFECPKSIKSIKKIILGTSDSWSTIRLSHRPSNPAQYIVDWRISRHVSGPRIIYKWQDKTFGSGRTSRILESSVRFKDIFCNLVSKVRNTFQFLYPKNFTKFDRQKSIQSSPF